jgi:hypothetical protein|tara:strand:+ start:1278 stop:1841 length:564 start_codon:yes stop_codon:yes gene_type:complete
MIPNSIAPDFFGRLLHGQRYVYASGMYQISCANKNEFQSIYLLTEGYWLEFHPEDYIIEVTTNNVTGCVLGFTATDMPYMLLGDVFLRGYYSVHDITNDRIGFAPHATSKKKVITEGANPDRSYKNQHLRESWDYTLMSWLGISTGWVILPFVFAVCGCSTFCCTFAICIYRCFQISNNVEETTSNA